MRPGEIRVGTASTFDHTADVGLEVRADDLDDLFRTAAEGLFDAMVGNRQEVRARDTERLEVSADSTAELLVAWLNELIYRAETGHRFYSQFDVHLADDGLSLAAVIGGEAIDQARHVLDHEVKAVTHHGLVVSKLEQGGWLAQLILDI